MVQPSHDRSTLGFVSIDNAPKPSQKVVEGYTADQYLNLYKSMVSSDGAIIDKKTQRKYGMTPDVEYPTTHPEYSPSGSQKSFDDSLQFLNQQYTNLTMIVATTAALGLIAIMITSSSSS
jgi:hypothetical protein